MHTLTIEGRTEQTDELWLSILDLLSVSDPEGPWVTVHINGRNENDLTAGGILDDRMVVFRDLDNEVHLVEASELTYVTVR
jgi:hypothetical protein